MAEDTPMETDGDNITREQVLFSICEVIKCYILCHLGVGPDETEGGFGS